MKQDKNRILFYYSNTKFYSKSYSKYYSKSYSNTKLNYL